jgi:hypothetical protein
MVDLPVGPDIGMATIRMLDVPMEVVRIAIRRRRTRNPLIPLIVQVTISGPGDAGSGTIARTVRLGQESSLRSLPRQPSDLGISLLRPLRFGPHCLIDLLRRNRR